ncbi:MAG: 50S ribosomal protein L19 [Candidatus Woesebacteria bacterium GW2011_GWE1_45_18]|uniref:50S ribosomal protein L19 n=2 Tax=Candidatus Woeseibacteriota TaxID=1752722 RepID=A0A1F8D4W5_9BACT|nr:MAG: 50S ribosomal protein L19 [Candidatus Woesebacteria bacterium GW2011_GWE1_45_18]OGM83386.1 MAG: 50S ribosomal protein L19 [Candidatus Woesebacteria bacterium RIFOXYB1_FULL_47_31]
MGLKTLHHETEFGVGDRIKVHQKIKEGEKERTQVFEGMVIALKNRQEGKTITLRRIGAGNVGIERIFPLTSPLLEKIEVVKRGTQGVRHAKLYFTREKSPKEIAEIYRKAQSRELSLKPVKKSSKKRRA